MGMGALQAIEVVTAEDMRQGVVSDTAGCMQKAVRSQSDTCHAKKFGHYLINDEEPLMSLMQRNAWSNLNFPRMI